MLDTDCFLRKKMEESNRTDVYYIYFTSNGKSSFFARVFFSRDRSKPKIRAQTLSHHAIGNFFIRIEFHLDGIHRLARPGFLSFFLFSSSFFFNESIKSGSNVITVADTNLATALRLLLWAVVDPAYFLH